MQSITDLEGDGNTEEVEQIKKKESSRLETLELMKRDDQILSKMSDGILLIIQHSDRENGNEPHEVLTVYINSILHTHEFQKRISAANIFNTDVFSLLLK